VVDRSFQLCFSFTARAAYSDEPFNDKILLDHYRCDCTINRSSLLEFEVQFKKSGNRKAGYFLQTSFAAKMTTRYRVECLYLQCSNQKLFSLTTLCRRSQNPSSRSIYRYDPRNALFRLITHMSSAIPRPMADKDLVRMGQRIACRAFCASFSANWGLRNTK
jgi:hypothetical protein